MVIDPSALVAILQDEPGRRAFNELIETATHRCLSTADRPAGIRPTALASYVATVPPRSEKLLILTVPSGKRATTSS